MNYAWNSIKEVVFGIYAAGQKRITRLCSVPINAKGIFVREFPSSLTVPINTKGIFEWRFPSSSYISFFSIANYPELDSRSLTELVTLDEGEHPFYELIRTEEVRI